jgi:hypothetical protein
MGSPGGIQNRSNNSSDVASFTTKDQVPANWNKGHIADADPGIFFKGGGVSPLSLVFKGGSILKMCYFYPIL